jgi:hypothetical protein
MTQCRHTIENTLTLEYAGNLIVPNFSVTDLWSWVRAITVMPAGLG